MVDAGISPFALDYPQDGDNRFPTIVANKSVMAVAEQVVLALKDVIERFRGVEAFYEVMVKVDDDDSNSGKRDTRKIVGIKELSGNYISPVNCLFTK